MYKILQHTDAFNFAALCMLCGILLVMITVNSYVLRTATDRILRFYNIYLLTSFLFTGWNIFKVAQAGSLDVLQNNSVADEFVTAVAGLGYLHFFGVIFKLDKAKKIFRYTWLLSLLLMYVQLTYLLALYIIKGKNGYIKEVAEIMFLPIMLSTLVILFYAIFLKDKSRFQKIIVAGSVIFYITVFLSNLQELESRKGENIGLNIFFFAFILEHLFFAVAAANRIKTVYAEAQQVKLAGVEQQLQIELLNKEMLNWQLSALRSQMNPHFLFNALNSIQQFTLTNEPDKANSYISRFSKLMRKVLHTSQDSHIGLEEEMEMLDLYLDIESLRMGKNFTYHIEVAEEIETDAIHIPSMLMQPVVENALIHGLLNKTGSRKIDISISLPRNEVLQVSVKDNGIGRAAALLIKQQQQILLPYTSKGLVNIEQRLAALNGSIRLTDIINEEGAIAGTEVILTIPLI